MAKAENEIFKQMQLALAHGYPRDRIFRNNGGAGWCGPGFFLKPGQVYHAVGGERLIMHPQLVHMGLFEGAGDGIGWHDLLIVPSMIGHHVAVFLSVETKAGKGKLTGMQANWREQVNSAGGIALATNDPGALILDLPPSWRL